LSGRKRPTKRRSVTASPLVSARLAPRLDQPNEGADHAVEQGLELRIEWPNPTERLGGFPTRECFSRRSTSRLITRLPILAARVGTLTHIERHTDQRAFELIAQR